MPRVPTKVVKDRSRRLSALCATFDPYKALVGTVQQCAAHAEVADGGARLVCHTKRYAKVLVPFERRLVGAKFAVSITANHRWHVDGVVLRVTRPADPAARPALREALAELGAGNGRFDVASTWGVFSKRRPREKASTPRLRSET